MKILYGITIVSALILSGCAPKYIPPVKNSKNTAQLTLPKQFNIGAFAKTPYVRLSRTDSKGCSKDISILPLI